MYDKVKEWSQKTFPDGHTMTIVRPTFFDCRLLFATRNFVFGMNNEVEEYQISSSGLQSSGSPTFAKYQTMTAYYL